MKFDRIRIMHSVICAIILVGLSGCSRVVDWGQQTFNQGKDFDILPESARSYIRSIVIYDQFTTVGMFDALWLSDDVRTLYTNAYAARRGKQEEFKKTVLRRQLEENKHFITFYVLSPFEYPLGESQSEWQLFLKVGNNSYFPIELKVVELEPEYKVMFGKKYSRFKESYCVKFDAKNIDQASIITPDIKKIELCFRSSSKEVSLTWPLTSSTYVQEQNQNSDAQQDCQQSQGNA